MSTMPLHSCPLPLQRQKLVLQQMGGQERVPVRFGVLRLLCCAAL
jgi:hypothetical protein